MKFFQINKGIALGIASLLLFVVFMLSPALAEAVYLRFFFQVIRVIWDYSWGLLPVPLLLVVLPLCLVLLVVRAYKKKFTPVVLLRKTVNGLAVLIALFFVCWGYNYACPTLAEKQQLKGSPVAPEGLFEFGIKVNEKAALLRKSVTDADVYDRVLDESAIRNALERELKRMGMPVYGRVRCRLLADGGFMRRMGVAGIYLPYFFEGYTNNTYLAVTTAFIMAHEMSHGYSITHEGEADFAAWLALSHSTDVFLQYAAQLELLRCIRGKLRYMEPDQWQKLKAATDRTVDHDLMAIYQNGLAYAEYVPGMQEMFNNAYLKTMGVEGGTKSYEAFVDLVYQYTKGTAQTKQGADAAP